MLGGVMSYIIADNNIALFIDFEDVDYRIGRYLKTTLAIIYLFLNSDA
jgi:hypothetical protein